MVAQILEEFIRKHVLCRCKYSRTIYSFIVLHSVQQRV